MRTLVPRALAAVLATALCWAVSAEPMPPTPAPAELLEATPFSLDEALALPSGDSVTSGLVVLLRADPGLTRPRQEAMPVLQLGERLAFPASRGGDGVLVAVFFGDADLGSSVLFFGPPELPSRVDHAAAVKRLADAEAAGLRPIGAHAATGALARGAAPVHVARFEDLSPFLMTLRCRIEAEALAAAGTPCPEAK